MNVDTLVAWGVKVLQWLDEPRPTGRELDADRIADKVGWLRDDREPLRQWEQALQVIETAETLVRREGHQAHSAAELRARLPGVKGDSWAGRLRGKLLAFMQEQAVRVSESETERLPGSSEVLESILGKYKTLQGERGQLGATSMLLSIGASPTGPSANPGLRRGRSECPYEPGNGVMPVEQRRPPLRVGARGRLIEKGQTIGRQTRLNSTDGEAPGDT